MSEQEFKESRAAFEARPDFDELIAEASKRGFRRITLSEQVLQLLSPEDIYLWRGGVWVRAA